MALDGVHQSDRQPVGSSPPPPSLVTYMQRKIVETIGNELKDRPLVFMDEGFQELVESDVGIEVLYELGAVHVLDLEVSHTSELEDHLRCILALCDEEEGNNIVILSSKLLFENMKSIIEVMKALEEVYGDAGQVVTVVSMVSQEAHHDADPKTYGVTCFDEISSMILECVKNDEKRDGMSVRCKHLDVCCRMIGNSVFVFPRHASTSFVHNRLGLRFSENKYKDVVATVTAHMLASVMRMLDVQPEAFCLGPMATEVGRSLAFVPSHDSTKGIRAAVVIVDRALDLASPSIHSDYLIHQMLERIAHKEDLDEEQWDSPSSSLFHPNDDSAGAHLNFLISKGEREASLFLRKWLKEAIRDSGLKFTGRTKPGAVAAADLEALVAVLKGDPVAAKKHASTVQLTEVACSCLEDTNTWKIHQNSEKILDLTCGDGAEALCGLVLDELIAAGRGAPEPHGIASAMTHLMIGSYWINSYSSTNPIVNRIFSDADIARMGDTLAEASILCIKRWMEQGDISTQVGQEMPWISPALLNRIQSSFDSTEEDKYAVELEIRDISQDVITMLTDPLKMLSETGNDTHIESQKANKSLLLKLCDDIVACRPIIGLHHMSTSLAGLLKSGLGRIGLQQQHHPGEYDIVVIFVVGGVSMNEASDVASHVDNLLATSSGKKIPRFYIGGSSLLYTQDALKMYVSSGTKQ